MKTTNIVYRTRETMCRSTEVLGLKFNNFQLIHIEYNFGNIYHGGVYQVTVNISSVEVVGTRIVRKT